VVNPNGVTSHIADFTVVNVIGTTITNPIDGATMVWVPSGTFIMGSIYGDEQPEHQVTLSGYWVYKYEVTVAQYQAFCLATSHSLPPFPSGYSWSGKLGWSDSALQQHPIVNVTYYDCNAYANWAHTSIPTEAQWEYAARGPQVNNYPWGGIIKSGDQNNGWDKSKCANAYNSLNNGKSTWPVGSFPDGASWCNAQDMAGNVWEWCKDRYGSYSSLPLINPTGPELGDYRILHGGSWKYTEYYNRCTYRAENIPNDFGLDINDGFRCVVNLP
jgi:formylglycine-generating enzyme required for sulfatase activity